MEATEEVVGGTRIIRYRATDAETKAAEPEPEPEPEPPRLARPRPPAFGSDAPARRGALDASLEARFRALYRQAMDEAAGGSKT